MDPTEIEKILDYVVGEAKGYLERLDDRPVRASGAEAAAATFGGTLPEDGAGGLESIGALVDRGLEATIASAGPRFFHFVIGGVTPAALGADWLASVLDQNNAGWVASPLGAQLEVVALSWLRELFGVPAAFGGILTTGATMANYTALACARRWWGLEQGVDVEEKGLSAVGPVPVFSSGYIHPSAVKALVMLGIGSASVTRFARDEAGRLDAAALERALADSDVPAIVVANAGEVNTGDFDPIELMADLAERYGAWLHVDGAFGLFAAASPRTRHLVAGIERAHSVISDGHKWLNVPYDCGFAFVRDATQLAPIFGMNAPYLVRPDDPHPNFGFLGPEGSRRARSLAVWATLNAYGRAGYRAMVERHLDLAQRIAAAVDAATDLERLADVQLNIVCFRYRPPGVAEEGLDDLNRRLAEAVLADGRVYVGSTVYEGRVAFRPAIVNWRTGEEDVDLLVEVVRELGARLVS